MQRNVHKQTRRGATDYGKFHRMDTGREWKRDVPGFGEPRAGLLLLEPDEPEHSEGRSILPE